MTAARGATEREALEAALRAEVREAREVARMRCTKAEMEQAAAARALATREQQESERRVQALPSYHHLAITP